MALWPPVLLGLSHQSQGQPGYHALFSAVGMDNGTCGLGRGSGSPLAEVPCCLTVPMCLG